MSGSQRRISGALLIAAALISGALFLRSGTAGRATSADVAVVVEAPDRTPIKTLDENKDGVPDWQESLLVTEALHIASTTTTYKEPETLTEQFALDFFQNVVRSENYGAFGDSPEQLVFDATDALAKEAVDELLTKKDILISRDDSVEAQALYGELIAAIISNYSQEDSINEAKILERALRNQDESELQELDGIITAYTHFITDTKKIPVPPSLQKAHLDLLNSYQAILIDTEAMRTAFIDPMYALLRLKRYQSDATGLYTAITNIYTNILDNGGTWDEHSIVFTLINIGPDDN